MVLMERMIGPLLLRGQQKDFTPAAEVQRRLLDVVKAEALSPEEWLKEMVFNKLLKRNIGAWMGGGAEV